MTVRANPPVAYRRRDDTIGTSRAPTQRWPYPRLEWRDGVCWEEIIYDNPDWVHLGWVPRPRTRVGRFIHHVVHGLLMRYPVVDVVAWSWRRTRQADPAPDLTETHTEGE